MRLSARYRPFPGAPSSRQLSRLGGALALLVAASCPEPPPEQPPGDYERHPGKGCGDSPSACGDDETLWRCEQRRWARVDCEQTCEAHGGLVGCVPGAGPRDDARCQCESEAGCDPDESRCVSDELVAVCDQASGAFIESSCESVCGALVPPHASQGCVGGECDCTLVGTPCGPESAARCTAFAIARCVDGVWELEDCLCSPGTCSPWGPEGPVCEC